MLIEECAGQQAYGQWEQMADGWKLCCGQIWSGQNGKGLLRRRTGYRISRKLRTNDNAHTSYGDCWQEGGRKGQKGNLDNGWPAKAQVSQSTAYDGQIIGHFGSKIYNQRCYLPRKTTLCICETHCELVMIYDRNGRQL